MQSTATPSERTCCLPLFVYVAALFRFAFISPRFTPLTAACHGCHTFYLSAADTPSPTIIYFFFRPPPAWRGFFFFVFYRFFPFAVTLLC